MKADPRFADMVFKIDEAEGHAFKKIFVRHKKELVTLRLEDDVDPNETTGQHLKPAEFYEKMQDPNTTAILRTFHSARRLYSTLKSFCLQAYLCVLRSIQVIRGRLRCQDGPHL